MESLMRKGLATDAQRQWRRCRPYIEAALARSPGLASIEDVEHRIASGAYQFWPGKRSACITEIAEFARAKALIVVHGGGDLSELVDKMEPALADFARAAGCDLIMGTGRKGWARVLEKRGYRFGWIVMLKALTQ